MATEDEAPGELQDARGGASGECQLLVPGAVRRMPSRAGA